MLRPSWRQRLPKMARWTSMSIHIWSPKMQAIARHSAMNRRQTICAALPLWLLGGVSSANGMEFDHTERIEAAAADVGCIVGRIGKGKKRGGEMVYRVTCDADGGPLVHEVACKLNRCVFKDDGVEEQ